MDHNESGRAPPPTAPESSADSYEKVTDRLTGVNVRLKDNIAQAIAAVVGLMAGLLVGWRWFGGRALIGGLVGLAAGAILVGLFLAAYRFFRH